MYDYARARMYYEKTCNDTVYVRITVHQALLRQNGFFHVFEGSFLEVPQVVQFHATVIHCHHGMDADDTLIFVLGSELHICPEFEVPVSQRKSRNTRVS